METNGLLQVLNNINILTPQIKSELELYLIEDHYPKKTVLLKAGQVSQRIYFVKQGFTRAYYHKAGNEFTSWFNGQCEIIVSVYSFFSRKPSFENIQVLEDSVLQSINWDQLQAMYKKYPEFNLTGRLVTEHYYIRSEERAINLQTLSAKERYENLLQSHPGILQKASLG